MGKVLNVIAGGAALVAIPTFAMESKEAGSSAPYRQSIIESTHSATEAVSLTAQDMALQVGPLTQTLASQLGITLQGVTAAAGGMAAAPATTQSTLPNPMGQTLPDPGATAAAR